MAATYKAQSTLELTISIVASIILMLGIFRIFLWFNKSIMDRQAAYQATRMQPDTRVTDFYNPQANKLKIFR